MSQDREATRGMWRVAVPKQQPPALPPGFMDQLLIHMNPHQHHPPLHRALHSAQIACSRWLALRRLRIGLTIRQLGTMTNLSAEMICLLEAGLADATLLSPDALLRLSMCLDPQRDDLAVMTDIIAVALGQAEALSVTVMDRVIDDLDVAIAADERDSVLAAEVQIKPDPVAARSVQRIPPALLKDEPAMFDILRILSEGENHAYAILQAIQASPEQSHDKATKYTPQFIAMLNRMADSGLIVKTGRRASPALPGKSLQYYQITAESRVAYHVERTRRALAAIKLNQKEVYMPPNKNTLLPNS